MSAVCLFLLCACVLVRVSVRVSVRVRVCVCARSLFFGVVIRWCVAELIEQVSCALFVVCASVEFCERVGVWFPVVYCV